MRETGPVFQVYADEEVGRNGLLNSQPYAGVARVVLGKLKNQLALGGIESGRLGAVLGDGTRIIAESRMGIDKITVISPSTQPVQGSSQESSPELPPPYNPEVEIPTQDLDVTLAAACGVTDQGGGVQLATLWSTLRARPTLLETATVSDALAISDDGSTVVGWRRVAGSNSACLWHVSTGVTDLGVPTPSQATCVSADGRTVGGTGVSQTPFVWNAGKFVELPTQYGAGQVTCISPSGQWAAGIMQVPPYGGSDSRAQASTQAVVWHRGGAGSWTYIAIPRMTSASRDQRLQGTDPGPRPDTWSPVNVDNAGRVTLVDNHFKGHFVTQGDVYYPYASSGTPYIPEYGETAVPGKMYLYPNEWYVVEQPTGAQFWSYQNGSVSLLDTGTAQSTADDVQVTIGNDQYGTREPAYLFQTLPGHPIYGLDGTTVTGYMYTKEIYMLDFYDPAKTVSRAWWWAPGRGQTMLAPDGAFAADISEDGQVIVGNRSAGDGTTVPCFWQRGQGAAVDMQFTGVSARARGVARPKLAQVSI